MVLKPIPIYLPYEREDIWRNVNAYLPMPQLQLQLKRTYN